jgi:predicted transcriptional regulator
MKGDTITVRLDDDLAPILDEVCRRSGRTRSEVMREALRRHLAQLRFEHSAGASCHSRKRAAI